MLGRTVFVTALLLLPPVAIEPAGAQTPTMGLIVHEPGAFEGYTLFECLQYPVTYLIDNDGFLVHSWTSQYDPGNMCYLLENGNLLRGADPGGVGVFNAGGGAGAVQEFDWDGNLLWEFHYSDSTVRHHHDVERLPNGNVLMIAWELKTEEEAIAAGRNPGLIWQGSVWPEHIIEVEPVGATGGNIVWEWHAWDHLIQEFDPSKENFGVVADHPELIDLNFVSNGNADWLHANAIDYHEDFDQIVISVNAFNEFWIIDHGTTTAEAAGHTGGLRGKGGDLLYRWGNPRAYKRGTPLDRKFYRQHDPNWIQDGYPGEGNLLIYNNGNGRPGGAFSSVEEIVTPVDANGDYPDPPPGVPHGPTAASWIYTSTPPESLYSGFVSGARRLPNGNTLICEGASGQLHEIDAAEQLVWMYINPVNGDGPMIQGDTPSGNVTFRASRYPPEYPAFEGRDLTPMGVIELDPNDAGGLVEAPGISLGQNFPNPFGGGTTISFAISGPSRVFLAVFDVRGRRVETLRAQNLAAGEHSTTWIPRGLPGGIYYYTLRVGGESMTRKMALLR